MPKKPSLPPPHPALIRRPAGRFGWLEDRLLHEDWFARLGPDATSVMVLLALAADQHGASFYRRDRMADKLGMSRLDVDRALARLLALRLVAHRPWHHDDPDGIWQLLPLPKVIQQERGGEPVAIGSLLQSLTLPNYAGTSKPPDSRAS